LLTISGVHNGSDLFSVTEDFWWSQALARLLNMNIGNMNKIAVPKNKQDELKGTKANSQHQAWKPIANTSSTSQ
jgi:hypothetical protein